MKFGINFFPTFRPNQKTTADVRVAVCGARIAASPRARCSRKELKRVRRIPVPALGGVARGQCLSTGIRQSRHHPPVGGLVQLEKSLALKQSSRPDLVGPQEYARLLACCLQDAPHGGCECH